MNRLIHPMSLSLLLLGAVALVGCAPLFPPRAAALPVTGKAPPQAAGMVPVAPRPPELPVGRYRSLTIPGPFVMSVQPDGRFLVFREQALVDAGTFTADNGRLMIDMDGCDAQGIKPALYDWFSDEDMLVFRAMGDDACTARRELLRQSFEPDILFVDNQLSARLN